MSNSEPILEDVFETLIRYVFLKPHIKVILKRLGFCCLRTIAQLTSNDFLETIVRCERRFM